MPLTEALFAISSVMLFWIRVNPSRIFGARLEGPTTINEGEQDFFFSFFVVLEIYNAAIPSLRLDNGELFLTSRINA